MCERFLLWHEESGRKHSGMSRRFRRSAIERTGIARSSNGASQSSVVRPAGHRGSTRPVQTAMPGLRRPLPGMRRLRLRSRQSSSSAKRSQTTTLSTNNRIRAPASLLRRTITRVAPVRLMFDVIRASKTCGSPVFARSFLVNQCRPFLKCFEVGIWKGDQNDIPATQGQSLSYSSMPGAFQSCSKAASDARTWAARFRLHPSSETRLPDVLSVSESRACEAVSRATSSPCSSPVYQRPRPPQ